MICAWCKSDIENDSFYCDQCSKEVFVCSVCGTPGKGKNCVNDGNPLYSPKQKASGVAPAPAGPAPSVSLFGSAPAPAQPAPQPIPPPAPARQQPVIPQQPAMPQPVAPQPYAGPVPTPAPVATSPGKPGLKLINKPLNIEIDIKDGVIIGRATGDHVAIFSQFSQVSSKHLQFRFDHNHGWTVTDLGSTNGVAISTQPNWSATPKLGPNTPVPVRDNTFLLIANIEFQLKLIAAPVSNSGTARL